MQGDYRALAAEKAIAAGIRDCSRRFEESPERALGLINEAAAVLTSYFPEQPYMIGELLGAHLASAAGLGRVDAVLLLKKLGANIDFRDNTGKTPLQKLAIDGKDGEGDDMMRTLAGEGAVVDALVGNDSGYNTIHAVVSAEKVQTLEVLLELGFSVDAPADVAPFDTALHILAKKDIGSSSKQEAERRRKAIGKIYKMLIESGADPCLKDANGLVPLVRAVEHGNDLVATRLLEDFDHPQDALDGALLTALYNNRDALIDPLIEAGANVRYKWNGQSIVDMARQHAKEPLLRRIASLVTEAELKAGMGDGASEPPPQAGTRSTQPSPL